LTLLPLSFTGPVGDWLGRSLWQLLGAGALGLPLLGAGLALAGFDRLPRLDMKRAALLIGGLCFLVPYIIGVATRVERGELDPAFPDRVLAAQATGLLPGFFAILIREWIGVAGALLFGFLALSALTLLTFAWHPLQRLERQPGEDGADAAAMEEPPRRRSKRVAAAAAESVVEDVVEPPTPVQKSKKEKEKEPRGKRSAPSAAALAAAANDERALPPVELLDPPPVQDVDAGEAQLDRLGQSLLDTLKTFKLEGSIAGRTTGPVVTQFEVVPAPGVKAGRIMALADDLAITMRAPSIRVAPIPGKGAVGVEVPNPTARMVTLRELFETGEWERARSTLPIAL